MRRWLRVLRGMLGMGLTFGVGAGSLAAVGGGLAWLIGVGSGPATAFVTLASALWAFLIGVTFSGVMALTARGRRFEELSLPRFAALGAGVGLVLYGLLAINAWDAWSMADALGNAGLFAVLGGGSATVSLLLARKARSELEPGDQPPRLEAE